MIISNLLKKFLNVVKLIKFKTFLKMDLLLVLLYNYLHLLFKKILKLINKII